MPKNIQAAYAKVPLYKVYRKILFEIRHDLQNWMKHNN